MKVAFVVLLCFSLMMLLCTVILLWENCRLRKRSHLAKKASEWHELAFTDALTGLQNRTAYNKKIIELSRKKSKNLFGILLFDVDNFKSVNDTEGHLAGDKVLQRVAQRLRSVFVSPDYEIYRFGGDEFAVICENADEDEIILLLLELRKFEKNDIRLSKGYAVVAGDVKKAFMDADTMLYADKASKKNDSAQVC